MRLALGAYLVQLEADKSDRERSRRGNRGDDLSGDQLRLVLVGGRNGIVGSSQVGCGGDEVNVVVGVIVFLEIDRRQSQTSERGWRWQRSDNAVNVFVVSVVLWDRLVFVDLNLDTALRDKLRNLLRLDDFAEDGRVSLSLQSVVESVQIGSCDEVLKVKRLYVSDVCDALLIATHVVEAEAKRVRSSLGARPERRTVGVDLVLWQVEQQLLDLVDVVALELQTRPFNTLRESRRSLFDEVLLDLLQLIVMLTGRLERSLDKVGLREVQVDRCWRVDVKCIECFSSPLFC